MTEHTKAQRLADILQYKIPSIECLEEAAAELCRLDALNAELVEALEDLSRYADMCELFLRETHPGKAASLRDRVTKSISAIAKARGGA